MINGVADGNGGKRKMGWKEANQNGVLSFSINAPISGNGTNEADKQKLEKLEKQYGPRSSPMTNYSPGNQGSVEMQYTGYQGAGGANADPLAWASSSRDNLGQFADTRDSYGDPAPVGFGRFYREYRGLTLDEMFTLRNNVNMPGYGTVLSFREKLRNKNVRVIRDPLDQSQRLDMQHFLSVGEKGEWAMALGWVAEFYQLVTGNKSAMNPVDYNSNYEGGNFFKLFGGNLKLNPRGLLDYINTYLHTPYYRIYVH